jgi:transposase
MSTYRLFVGIDVSATQAHVAWGYAPEQVEKMLIIDQTPTGIEHLIQQLQRVAIDPSAILIVIEATGTYWMRLAVALHEAGFSVSVINPAQAYYFGQAQLHYAKTDPIDAQLLMQLAVVLQPALWTPPPAVYYALQQSLRQRDDLIAIRTQEKNRWHALQHQPTIISSVADRLHQHIAFLDQQIADLDREIVDLLKTDPDWALAAQRLQTIPGVGVITAAWIMTATLNFTLCETPEQATAYAGLAPHPRQSGTSLKSYRSLGHGGHARLRSALYMAALPASRYNPIIRTFYLRLVAHGKPKKVALCAAARKLLHIAWALITKQRVFDPSFERQVCAA